MNVPDMTPDRSKAARELLAFYVEAGVDAAIGEAAKDRLLRAGAACKCRRLGPHRAPATDGAKPARPADARATRRRSRRERCRAAARPRRRRDGGARSRTKRRKPRRAARDPRPLRRLRPERLGKPSRVRRRHAGLAADAGRRGAGRRGGQAGPAVRRTLGAIARPHAQGDRARPQPRSTSPTSCRGGRRATARRRRSRRKSACRSSSVRSSCAIRTCW